MGPHSTFFRNSGFAVGKRYWTFDCAALHAFGRGCANVTAFVKTLRQSLPARGALLSHPAAPLNDFRRVSCI